MAKDIKSAPAERGRFEAVEAKFAEITKGKTSDVLALDLREALPDIITSATARVPRLVQKVWRRACDEVLSEDRGIYYYPGATVIRLYFYELTAGIAKAKVDAIRRKIPQILKAAQADDSIFAAPLPGAGKTDVPKVVQQTEQQSLAAAVREGLADNPQLEAVQMWSARAAQNMAATHQKIPVTREMIDLASRSNISYLPMWNAAGQIIVGSCGDVRGSVPVAQYNTGETHRQDLALLFGASFQVYSLLAKGGNALVMLPVRAGTLTDKDTGLLYIGLLRHLSPEVQKSIIIEVTAMPKGTAAPSLVAAVDKLLQCTRAVIFQAGLLAYNDYSRQFPKLHAVGFDSEDTLIGEAEQVRIMKKYAEHYKGINLKTGAKHIHSPYVLDAAIRNGFTYISGPVIRPAQRTCFTVQKCATPPLKQGIPPAPGAPS